MAFRVLIIGGRHLTSYADLRSTLDALLANRLPDVELLTVGGPGVPMLAASYASERGLKVTALVPEYGRFPEAAAVERRDGELVFLADAAVVVWSDCEPGARRLLALAEAKGIPAHVAGGSGEAPRMKKVKAEEVPRDTRRGLPD